MKYRLLTKEELLPLEEDLKHFLIINGIHGDEWKKMNEENPDKATELVGIFSDTVLQKVYEKIKFLEFRTSDSCLIFALREASIELIAINTKAGGDCDLSTPESIHEALTHHADQLTFFKSKKEYHKEREAEIHEMMESGCVPSHESFWMMLNKAL